MSATLFLGILAALLHGIAYFLYAVQTKLGASSPKSASWGLWVLLVAVNWATFGISVGNWSIALQFLSGSIACVSVFIYMLVIGKLSWPAAKDRKTIGLSILAIIVWVVFKNAAWANVVVFIALAISFIPMYEELWADPSKEMPRSWILWTMAFLVTATNVILNWGGKPLSLVMPIGGALLHGAVAVLSSESRKRRFGCETRS